MPLRDRAEAADAEVIVVGAGPAGASTAFHLARRGRRTLLLERRAFPRDKSCGDGLTPSAVRLLGEMGVLAELAAAQPILGVRVFMRGKGSRDFHYPRRPPGEAPSHGLVVPRLQLDHALCRRAVAAGAELWERAEVTKFLGAAGGVSGVEVRQGEVLRELHAPLVVLASGASLRLTGGGGETAAGAGEEEGLGFAVRRYYEGIEGLAPMLEIYMPLTDVSDRYLLPSYGWVFPTGPATANVGVGLFRRERRANVRELGERFVDFLERRDSRFAKARPSGPWLGAPLRCDFQPERCVRPGLLLVGDAAGLVSPFTGEGISYALESGKLAAQTIDRNLRPEAPAGVELTEYATLLAHRYTGYFEAGRRGTSRYRLIWRLVESTFHDEKPLFQLCRRAVLFPEGVGETPLAGVLTDVSPLISRQLDVREDLLAVGEVLIDAVRREWPFLARLSAAGHGDPGIPLRPALLLLLAGTFGHLRQSRRELVRIAAALELGYAAALAHLSVEERAGGEPQGAEPADWGNLLAVMVGDFLLTRANELAAQIGHETCHEIAQALAAVAAGRFAEVGSAFDLDRDPEEALRVAVPRMAILFELPCRLGAAVSGAGPEHTASLAAYGRHLGMAFELTEQVLEIEGRQSDLGRAARDGIRSGACSLPILLALARPGANAEALRAILAAPPFSAAGEARVRRLVSRSGAARIVASLAGEHGVKAQAALERLPAGPARDSLAHLAGYVAGRATPAASAAASGMTSAARRLPGRPPHAALAAAACRPD
jgi:menaquinone-9 beta-reductase